MSSRFRSSTRATRAASDSLAELETKMKSEPRASRGSAKSTNSTELTRLTKIATLAFLFSFVIIGTIIYFTLNDVLRLHPTSITVDSLKGFFSRVEFSLRYQTLLYLWLLFNLQTVIYIRYTRKALNPLNDSTEKYVLEQKNILTNSFEQIIISSFLQLGFTSFASPTLVMKLVPAVNITQFAGRIAYFLGYPLYRTLGFWLTMIPNLLMAAYNVHKFGSHMGLY